MSGWNSPLGHLYVTGEIVAAATLNTYVAYNLDDLDRRTSPIGDVISANQTTTSTSYTDLPTAGPAVSAVIGSTFKALLTIRGGIANNTAGVASFMGAAMSGAATFAAQDSTAIGVTSATANVGIRCGMAVLYTALGAGSVTATGKYRTDPGGTATAVDRGLSFTPLGS